MDEQELFAEIPVDVASLPSLRAEHFPYAGPYPWLDQPDAEVRIEARERSGQITPFEAEQCRWWAANGYIILKGLIEHEILDDVWSAYERAVANETIPLQPELAAPDDPYPGRFLDPHDRIPEFCQVLRHPALLNWMQLLTEREPKPFQTITSHKGSQQGSHSDSIHMTTYPLGYLTAAWVAFEDIHPDSGPLVYYPGSHRLPYLFSKDVGITESDFKERGYLSYRDKYEPAIRKLIEHEEPHYFHAQKGDVLIWHANLIHGGSKRLDIQRSRKALVCHFFAKGAIAYHDLASAPTKPYSGTCLIEHQAPSVSVESEISEGSIAAAPEPLVDLPELVVAASPEPVVFDVPEVVVAVAPEPVVAAPPEPIVVPEAPVIIVKQREPVTVSQRLKALLRFGLHSTRN